MRSSTKTSAKLRSKFGHISCQTSQPCKVCPNFVPNLGQTSLLPADPNFASNFGQTFNPTFGQTLVMTNFGPILGQSFYWQLAMVPLSVAQVCTKVRPNFANANFGPMFGPKFSLAAAKAPLSVAQVCTKVRPNFGSCNV